MHDSASPSSGAERAARRASLDIAKGVAILLVVLFHAVQGLQGARLLRATFASDLAEAWAYGFHVQIFFLIAGYLAYVKADKAEFQVSRFVSLYYSYILWSVITFAIGFVMSKFSNHAFTLTDLMLIPVLGILHFWFMLALIICTATLYFVRSEKTMLLVTISSVACLLFLPDWNKTAYFLPFMIAGAFLGRRRILPPASALPALICASVMLIAAWIATSRGLEIRTPPFMIASLAGAYALFTFSEALAETPLCKPLNFIGRYSLAVYLTHGLFMTAFRIIGVHIGLGRLPYGGELLVLLLVLGGVTGPLMAARIAEMTKFDRLLGFKAFKLRLGSSYVAAVDR